MPFIIVRNDITLMKVDAIVNAANSSLLGGGGVDGAIHRAAGPGLLNECRKLGGCRPGEAKLTGAYRLPCSYVIHTVGPIWRGGGYGEEETLRSCYLNSLKIASGKGCASVAFPLISSGVYGYPRREAIRVASEAIEDFIEDHDITVYLVMFDRDSFVIGADLMGEIEAFVDDHYCEEHADAPSCVYQRTEQTLHDAFSGSATVCAAQAKGKQKPARPKLFGAPNAAAKESFAPPAPIQYQEAAADEVCSESSDLSLEEMLKSMDEGFSQNLLRRIDAAGMKDSECYKRANIDRKLFSKIRSDPGYRPSKATAVAFAIALKLDMEGARDLIGRAGYAFTRSSKFDVIIEYFITQKRYDIFEINEALFAFDQPILGS
ncbi:MAG: macro domain-containing protein [Clostridia bacterium]|nr:macro domain-containing protein [Clostridia bacterium]